MVSKKLKEDFLLFRDHCVIIRRDYNTYCDLFFSGADEILKATAKTFFSDISQIMQRDWLLQVCKLMDSPKKRIGGEIRETISIKLLNNQLAKDNLLTDRIEQLSKSLLRYGTLIVPARNRVIAHFDRDTALKQIVLGGHTEEELAKFLADLQQYCDEVGWAIGVGPLDFTASGCKGDVWDLIKILKAAKNSLRRKRC